MESYWSLVIELGAALGVKPKTVAKWRERDHVPYRWRYPLAQAAKTSGRRLPMTAFERRPANGEEAVR